MPPHICNTGLYAFQRGFPRSTLLTWQVLSPEENSTRANTGDATVFHLLKHFPSCAGDSHLQHSGPLRLGRRKIGKLETIEISFLALLNSSITWDSELGNVVCESWKIPEPSAGFVLPHGADE